MIQALFKQVKDGELRRMAFLGYWLLLVVLMMAFVLAIVMAIGVGEQLMGGDLAQAQDILRERFSLPLMLILSAFVAAILFGHSNVAAKRFRHIGLPGWWSVLIVVILKLAVTWLINDQAGGLVGLLTGLVLLFVPGGMVGKKGLSV